MEIQQIIVQQKTFSQLMLDPVIKTKIIKVVIQTLYNLGYQKSAKQLEKQSGIKYQTQQLSKLKMALKEKHFKQAWKSLNLIPIKSIQERKIVEENMAVLECQMYIEKQDINKALEVLSRNQISQQKANELCQKLTFYEILNKNNTKNQCNQQAQILQDSIIQKCLQNDIQPRSMQKIILFYLQLQRQGLIPMIDSLDIDQSFSLLNLDQCKRQPPMKIVTIGKDQFQQKIQFIKFNSKGNIFVTVGSGNIIDICIYDNPIKSMKQKFNKQYKTQQNKNFLKKQVESENQVKSSHQKMHFNRICQREIDISQFSQFSLQNNLNLNQNQSFLQVEAVTWSHSQDILAIATKSFILTLDLNLKQLSKINFSKFYKSQQNQSLGQLIRNNLNKKQSILSIQFNPISNLIYCAGYFNYVLAISYLGQEISRIQPFFKTRQIVFNLSGTKMYAIGLIQPKVVLINLFTEKQEASFIPYEYGNNFSYFFNRNGNNENNIPPSNFNKFTTKAPFMSINIEIQKNSGKVVVSNRDFIYVLNQNLNVLKCFTSPSNKGNFLLESYIFDPWIVTLGDHFCAQNMSALINIGQRIDNKMIKNGKNTSAKINISNGSQKGSSTNNNLQKQYYSLSWPGSGSFAIFQDYMISGKKQLILWKSNNNIKGGISSYNQKSQLNLLMQKHIQQSQSQSENLQQQQQRSQEMQIQNNSQVQMQQEQQEDQLEDQQELSDSDIDLDS